MDTTQYMEYTECRQANFSKSYSPCMSMIWAVITKYILLTIFISACVVIAVILVVMITKPDSHDNNNLKTVSVQ